MEPATRMDGAVAMVARCMLHQDPAATADTSSVEAWKREDLEWLAEKLNQPVLPEEPMGWPGAA